MRLLNSTSICLGKQRNEIEVKYFLKLLVQIFEQKFRNIYIARFRKIWSFGNLSDKLPFLRHCISSVAVMKYLNFKYSLSASNFTPFAVRPHYEVRCFHKPILLQFRLAGCTSLIPSNVNARDMVQLGRLNVCAVHLLDHPPFEQ